MATRATMPYAAVMRFDEKAREGIEAAERLLPDNAGERAGLHNASASRAYYAAYHAIADVAQQQSRQFTSERDYYRHDSLPHDARRWGIVDDEERADLDWLYGLRIKADYLEDQVDIEEASEAFAVARQIVRRLVRRTGSSIRAGRREATAARATSGTSYLSPERSGALVLSARASGTEFRAGVLVGGVS